jgi:solute carrier family 6 amino acid/orphan transporter-like 15/16/17/18/20
MPILVCFILSTYYNLLEGLSFYYFFASFKYPLPWSGEIKMDQTTHEIHLPAKEYFYDTVLKSTSLSEYSGFNWPIYICYIISMAVVFVCIVKGIK